MSWLSVWEQSHSPSCLHYCGMHSLSAFVLTSKDESLPPQPFEIFCGGHLDQHIFCPMQKENLGTSPRSSFVFALGCRDLLWPLVKWDSTSLCRSPHFRNNLLWLLFLLSFDKLIYFSSGTKGSSTNSFGADSRKTLLVSQRLSSHIIKSDFS